MSTNPLIPEDRMIVWDGTNTAECIQLMNELSVENHNLHQKQTNFENQVLENKIRAETLLNHEFISEDDYAKELKDISGLIWISYSISRRNTDSSESGEIVKGIYENPDDHIKNLFLKEYLVVDTKYHKGDTVIRCKSQSVYVGDAFLITYNHKSHHKNLFILKGFESQINILHTQNALEVKYNEDDHRRKSDE